MNNSLEYQHDLSNFDGDIQQIQQYYQNLNAQNKQNSLVQRGIAKAKETGEQLKSAHEYMGAVETALGSAYAPKIVSDVIRPSYYALKSKLGLGGDPAEEAAAGAAGDAEGAAGAAADAGGAADALGALGGAAGDALGALGGAAGDALGAVGGAAGDALGAVGGAVANALPAMNFGAGIGVVGGAMTPNNLIAGRAGMGAYNAAEDIGLPAPTPLAAAPDVPLDAAPPIPGADDIPISPQPDDPFNPDDIRPWENADAEDVFPDLGEGAEAGEGLGQVGQAGGGLAPGVEGFDGIEGAAPDIGAADAPIVGALGEGAEAGADVGAAAGGAAAGVGADVGAAAGGAALGAVDSTAAANWWNPLGWVLGAAGLAVGGYEAYEALEDSHKAAQQQHAIDQMGPPARVNPGDISGSYIQPVLNQSDPN